MGYTVYMVGGVVRIFLTVPNFDVDLVVEEMAALAHLARE